MWPFSPFYAQDWVNLNLNRKTIMTTGTGRVGWRSTVGNKVISSLAALRAVERSDVPAGF